jgi:hypothetical protein
MPRMWKNRYAKGQTRKPWRRMMREHGRKLEDWLKAEMIIEGNNWKR